MPLTGLASWSIAAALLLGGGAPSCSRVPAAAAAPPVAQEAEVGASEAGEDFYAEALSAYRSGDMEAARLALDRARRLAPPRAALETLRGWVLLRGGDAVEADAAFESALEIEPEAAEPRAGRGYAALQRGDPLGARQWFEAALEREPQSSDAARGRVRALFHLGEFDEAAAALEPLLTELPEDGELHELADKIRAALPLPGVERRPRGAVTSDGPPEVITRAGRSMLEVPAEGDGWKPVLVKGVNLGVALPGKFPSEFPPEESTYFDWLERISSMNANAVRLYTLLPPAFYDALARHNRVHPERSLWLIQGVWAVLPPEHDFEDPGYRADLEREVERVIDAYHGNLDLPARPGHAAGRYRSDVSHHVLGLILGREWEPYSVVEFNQRHPGSRSFSGKYATLSSGSAMEAWLAWLCDTAMAHETRWYGMQRPLAFSNWPTLDPLHHPTESTRAQELEFRRALGEVVDERPSLIYNDDAVSVDAEKIRPAEGNRAGFFASYHIYPYFPDFMNLEPAYRKAFDTRGASPYIGYLRDLKAHHASQPLLVAEFGVPTSRGVAHVHPLGWNHGGHSETRQGELLARMMLDIVEAGTAGGIAFAWLDEWFKKTWMFSDLTSPPERNRRWHNVLDPEQNFGILAARAGTLGGSPIVDGDGSEWDGLPGVTFSSFDPPSQSWEPCRTDSPRPSLQRLGLFADPAYLYVLSEIRGADCDQDGTLNWDTLEILIGIDTYDPQAGDRRLRPGDSRRLPSGVEFRVRLAGPGNADIQVDTAYDVESHLPGGPIASVANEDGVFTTMTRETNRRRFGRDGTEYPAIQVSSSALGFAGSPWTDVAAGASATTGIVEMRLPWSLLQFTDPSERTVLHQTATDGPPFGTATSDGVRLHLSLRDGDGQEVDFQSAPLYTWPVWQEPTYHLELKQSYEILREAFASLPGDGP